MVKISSCGSPKKKFKANPRICSVTTGYHQIDNFFSKHQRSLKSIWCEGIYVSPRPPNPLNCWRASWVGMSYWTTFFLIGRFQESDRGRDEVFNHTFFFTMKNTNQTKNLLKYFYQEAGTIYINGCNSVKHCLLQSWWSGNWDAFKTFITVAQPPWGEDWESLSYASTGYCYQKYQPCSWKTCIQPQQRNLKLQN